MKKHITNMEDVSQRQETTTFSVVHGSIAWPEYRQPLLVCSTHKPMCGGTDCMNIIASRIRAGPCHGLLALQCFCTTLCELKSCAVIWSRGPSGLEFSILPELRVQVALTLACCSRRGEGGPQPDIGCRQFGLVPLTYGLGDVQGKRTSCPRAGQESLVAGLEH